MSNREELLRELLKRNLELNQQHQERVRRIEKYYIASVAVVLIIVLLIACR